MTNDNPTYLHDADGWWWYKKGFFDNLQVPIHGPFELEAHAIKDNYFYLFPWMGGCARPYALPSKMIIPLEIEQ